MFKILDNKTLSPQVAGFNIGCFLAENRRKESLSVLVFGMESYFTWLNLAGV